METPFVKILLFTVNACPMGRTIGKVLEEVKTQADVPLDVYFVDEHVEETNHYRVKTNPTTIFVDEKGMELYRFEGFKETEDVLVLLQFVRDKSIHAVEVGEKNQESVEKYVVYLSKDGVLAPIEIEYVNSTSVKTPRITAVKQLLKANPTGYVNPFPEGSTLELVQFEGKKGRITLKVPGKIGDEQGMRMEQALQKTLSHFAIESVEMILA